MHNYVLKKMFKTKDIPENLISPYAIQLGHSILFNIDANSTIKQQKNLSLWLIESGALDLEQVFLFHD